MNDSNHRKVGTPAGLNFRKRLAFLAKDSLIYGSVGALEKVFVLLTFPLLARYFSVNEYGIIDYFLLFNNLLVILFVFGQDSAVARLFYEYTDEKKRCSLVSQSLIFQMAVVFLLLPVFWLFAGSIAQEIDFLSGHDDLMRLIILQIPFLVLVNFSKNLLKWTFSRKYFLIVSLGTVTLNMVLLILGVFVFKMGVIGVFQISLLVNMVFGMLGIFFIRQWLIMPGGWHFLAPLLAFAIPYGVLACIGAFVPVMERSLVQNMLGAHSLGLYAAGAKVAMVMVFVSSAFHMAWGPFYLSIHKESNASETYNLVLKGFSIGACLIVLLISSIGEIVITSLASNRYDGAGIIVFPLAMGLALRGVGWITGVGIDISKKSYLNLYGYIGFICVAGLGIYCFTQKFGLFGVALGMMAGYVVNLILVSWLAQKAHILPWKYKEVVVLMSFTAMVGLTASWVTVNYGIFSASLLYFVGAVGVTIIAWMYVLDIQEREGIMGLIKVAPGNTKHFRENK